MRAIEELSPPTQQQRKIDRAGAKRRLKGLRRKAETTTSALTETPARTVEGSAGTADNASPLEATVARLATDAGPEAGLLSDVTPGRFWTVRFSIWCAPEKLKGIEKR